MMVLGCAAFVVNAQPLENNDEMANQNEQEALIRSIEFVEIEEKEDLHAALLRFLPNDFDPYKGMVIDSSDIHFQKVCEPVEVNMNTQSYLPKGFNPYVGL